MSQYLLSLLSWGVNHYRKLKISPKYIQSNYFYKQVSNSRMNALFSRSLSLLGVQKNKNPNAEVFTMTLPPVSLCKYSVLCSDDTCTLSISLLPRANGQLLRVIVQETFTKSFSISNSFFI